MRTLALFLFALASPVFAAVTLPTMSTVPSRTTCTAPCAVFFDATATTSDQTSTPFHNVDYSWNFGDTTAGNWTYGAALGSKNFAKGPVAAHVFETAGTFTVTLTASDGTSPASRGTVAITVTAANTTFSTTNTTCVANGTTPVAGVGGCPAGAAVADSADFDAAISGASFGSGKRILFKGGDTFTASVTTTLTDVATAQIGSYGTGKAVVNWTGAGSANGIIRIAGTSSDVRITDLEMDGLDIEGLGPVSFANTAWTNLLLLNNYMHGFGLGLGPDWAANGGSGLFMVGNRCEDYAPTMTADGVIPGSGSIIAIMGNNFAMGGLGQQAIRINHSSKYVVQHNSVSGVIATKSSIDFRSSDARINQYGIASDNSVSQGASLYGINPSSASTNLGIFDLIIERNYVLGVAAGETNNAIATNAERVTVRNNLIDATSVDMTAGINLRGTNSGNSLPSKDVWVYNNTLYTAQASAAFAGVSVDTTASTGNVIRNNLVYSPTITATAVSDSGAVATKSNNTAEGTGAGSVKTNPFLTTPTSTLSTWRIDPASYADAGGTASFPAQNRDFYNCEDKTGDNRIGALVAAANRQCYGVAQ